MTTCRKKIRCPIESRQGQQMVEKVYGTIESRQGRHIGRKEFHDTPESR